MTLKKILSLLIAMIMALGCVSIPAMAEGDLMNLGDLQNLINSGEENIVLQNNIYEGVSSEEDLKAAIAEGGSITLGADFEITEMIEIPAEVEVELDLAGYSITSGYQTDSTKHIYPFSNYGVLTITDSSAEKTGSISGRGIYNQDGAKITVNNAKIVSQDTNGGACIWGYGSSGEVYLNDATLIGYTGVVSSEGYVEINGGTYTCYSGIADDGRILSDPTYNIRAYNGLKITDGDFTSRHGVIYLGGGEAVIEDGTYTIEFNAKITSNVVYIYGNTDLTIDGGEFISDDSENVADSGAAVLVSGDSAKLTINDGTYVGMNGMVSGNDNTVIKGGSFDTVFDYNDYGNIEKFVETGAVITVAGETIIKNEEGTMSKVVAMVEDTPYATLAAALTAASDMTGDVAVEIYDKVTLNQSLSGSYDSIKFVGKDTDAEIYLDVQGYITATGKAVAFENLILSKSAGGFITNAGFMNVAFGVYDVNEVTYTNCTFANGAYASSGEVTFTGCTFKRSHEKYGLWAYGNVDCTVDNCIFDDYRGIKMYAEGAAKTVDLTVKNTDFSALDSKPAIVLTYGESVTLENNTYSSTGVFELDLDGAPNGTTVTGADVENATCINDNGACGVLVDGKIYTTVAQAAAVATKGNTVTLLHDSTETVELPEGVTLDANGHTAENVTVKVAVPKGTMTVAYTSKTDFWGEAYNVNASKSFEIKIYSNEELLSTTKLNNIGNIIDGDISEITWHNTFEGNFDEYWTTEWEEGYPNAMMKPEKAVLYVDGSKVDENEVQLNAADNLNKIVAAAEDKNGKFLGYFTSVEDAAAVANEAGAKIVLHRDTTETVELAAGVTFDKNGFTAEGVTVAEPSLSGSGTEEDPYLINNLAELKWFRDNVNTYTSDGSNQYKGKYVKLNADIDLAGENWEPIGNNANNDHESFMGIFDGGGHTIKNLYVNSNGDHLGFFARIGSYAEGINPTVKNITFENVDVSSNTLNGHGGSYVGGVIANAGGNSIVENVKVKGNIYVTGYGYVGGIVGHGYPDLTDCSVIGNDGSWVHAHYWCAGGIIGYAGEGGTPITNCHVEGLDIWSAYGAAAAVAGLLQDGNKLTNISAKDVEITSNSDYCMGVVAGNGEASTLINVTATNVTATANGNEINYTDAVAKVNNTYYATLNDAIKAAAPNGTVEILSDIVVDEWVMFSQTKTIGGDTLITLDMNGLTINGNDHTLTVKAVESATNGDYLFDTADNIIINDLTVNLPAESNGLLGGSGGTLDNVNINGGKYSLTVSKTKNLTIKNCTFAKESGTAIYTPGDNDSPKDTPYTSTLTIDGCKFNVSTAGEGYAVILRGKNDVFTNNVTNNKVNVLGENCTLTGNTFNARLKFYPSNPTVKDNKILGTVEYADDTETIDLSQNYWGENMNEETILATVGEKATVSSYYTTLNADGTLENLVSIKKAVAQIGDTYYETFEDALNAVENGQTITLLDVTGSELSNEIDFTKDISFTITGKAPNYALPVVTFQNAEVTIKDAEILIPELDARQNATINVVDSIVRDAGGNSIVKSYYNGAINISGTSVVHTMQVTTMGYITISDTAELNATWQTNVYGNGMITVEETATFATAALQLTGKDYSGRDNTDADRIGKPATIVVDGATLIVGKVYSDNGADYSYNSSKGINIGTIDGKSAVLDIKNGATVNIYMANGETANIGANGTVNVNNSKFDLACRKADGTVTLANNGVVNVSGTSDIAAKVTGAGWVYMNGVTLGADTKLIGAKVRFASGTNNVEDSVIDDGFFQVGIGAYNGVDANVDTENGVTVNVKNAKIGSNGETYAGWIGTGFYDTDAEKAAAMTDAKYILNIENSIAEFGYLHISNDGELNVNGNAAEKEWYNNSDYSFYAGDFIINGVATFNETDVLASYTKVSCDNGTNNPGTLNIKNGADYEAERHNGAIDGTNFILYKTGVVNVNDAKLHIGEYTSIAAAAVMNIGGEVTALGTITNNGKINLTTADATLTTPEAPTVNSAVDGYEVVYADDKYIMTKVSYVAQIGETKYTSLQAALDAAAAGTGDVTVEILEDIDLTNVDWTPVTVSAPGYPVVTVNGKGKTITGLNDMLFAGTWAGGSGLIINDLTIKDSNIVNDENDSIGTVGVGAFIGYPQASATITLNNCHLVNSSVSGGHWTGGLIGMAGGYNGNDGPVFMNLTITDCSVTGSTITGKGSVGGIIGHGSCAAWTNVVIENTTVSGNTITSTGSSSIKAGAVMGTIGAAGQSTTANGETKTGGASVSATVSDNTVTSNGTPITTIYGRQGTSSGMLYVTGGTYDNYPIEENVEYAQPKEGYEIVLNENGTYGLEEVKLFEFYQMNLDLESSMKVNFYILASYFEGTDYYAEIVHSSANGDIKRRVDFADWKDNNSYKQISYTDLVAKNMADRMTITIYDGKGNQVSVAQEASIKTYAEKYLGQNAGKGDKWVTTFVDMLNYGAEAQKHFGYNEENLANADIGKYQIYATQQDIELQNIAEVSEHVYQANLDLENRIVYNGYFIDVTDDMYAEVSYTDHIGNLITNPASIVKSGSYYKVAVDTLVIADADQLVTITVYDGDGNVFAYIKDTVNGYLCRVIPAEPEFEPLARAMAKFTASAHTALHTK